MVGAQMGFEMKSELYIDGQWLAPVDGTRLAVVDPATEEVFHHVGSAGAGDIDRAVDAAARASKGAWRRTTGRERATYLRSIAAAIETRKHELARLEVLDNGKPLPEAEWDVADAAACFSLYAELAEQLDERQGQEVTLCDRRFVSSVRHEPTGVAALIIPWNFPLLMAAWKVAPAIAAGCTMILKPSEFTPLSALVLAEIAAEVGLPPGVLNVVTGIGTSAGAPLAQHPEVRKVAFTGSVPTGSLVAATAAQGIKNVSLELGGKSPFVVFDDADVEAAVEWIMFGIFWNQGEVCSATSRLLLQDGIAPTIIERLREEAPQIKIGNGLEPGTQLGPLVSQKQQEKVLGFIERGKRDARLLVGGSRPAGFEKGYFIEPTIFVDIPSSAEIWREEIFGPVLCIQTFSDEAQALYEANSSRFGLAAAVMSSDLERCERVAAELEAGIVWINCSQPTFAEAPWGGVKHSGVGRELGEWGLQSFLEIKQVTRYTSSDPWGWYLSTTKAGSL